MTPFRRPAVGESANRHSPRSSCRTGWYWLAAVRQCAGDAPFGAYYTGHGGPLSLRAITFAAEDAVGYIIGGYSDRSGEADDGKFTLTLRKGTDGR